MADDYERGYRDGESSGYADFEAALDNLVPDEVLRDLTPSKLADWIQQQQRQIDDLTDRCWMMVERMDACDG